MAAKSTKHTKKNINRSSNLWQLEALEPKLLMSADLMPGVHDIQGSIEQLGEQDIYELVINETSKLFFDGAQGNNINWKLESIVNNQPITQFSAKDLTATGDKLLNLTAGNYRLTVDGNNQTVDNYKFRILGESAAQTLTTNQATTGELTTANQAKLYRIPVKQGDTLYYKGDTNNQGQWSLFDNQGNLVINAASLSQDKNNLTANQDGDYWLSLEGIPNTEKINYNFTLYQTPKSTTTALAFNTPTAINFQPGAGYTYDFSVDKQQLVGIDFLNQIDSGVTWSIYNKSTQQTVVTNSQVAVNLLSVGDYQLTIKNTGTLQADNQLRLVNVNQATNFDALPQTLSYTPDINYQAQLKAIHVDVAGNYVFDTQGHNYNLSIYDKYNRLINKTNINTTNVTIALNTGDYYLWLDPQVATIESSIIVVGKQTEQVQELGAITNDNSIILKSTLTEVGQKTTYHFTLTDSVAWAPKVVGKTGDMTFTLTSDEGVIYNNITLSQLSNPLGFYKTLKAGDYTLTLTNTNNQFNADQGVALQKISSLVTTEMMPNQSINLSDMNINEQHVYKISATAADNFYLSGGYNLYDYNITVIDKFGKVVAQSPAYGYYYGVSNFNNQQADSDLYVLIKRQANAYSGAQLTLNNNQITQPDPQNNEQPIPLGQAIQVAPILSTIQAFQFSLDKAGSIDLAFTGYTGSVDLKIIGPMGEVFNRQQLTAPTNTNFQINDWMPAGVYYIELSNFQNFSGTQFTLSSMPMEQPNQPGLVVQSYQQDIGTLNTQTTNDTQFQIQHDFADAYIDFTVDEDSYWAIELNSQLSRGWQLLKDDQIIHSENDRIESLPALTAFSLSGNEELPVAYPIQSFNSGTIINLTKGKYTIHLNPAFQLRGEVNEVNRYSLAGNVEVENTLDDISLRLVNEALAKPITIGEPVVFDPTQPYQFFKADNTQAGLYQYTLIGDDDNTLPIPANVIISDTTAFNRIKDGSAYFYIKTPGEPLPLSNAKLLIENSSLPEAPSIQNIELNQDWQIHQGNNLFKFIAPENGLLFADANHLSNNQYMEINSIMDGWGERNNQYDGSALGISGWSGIFSPMPVFKDQPYYLATNLNTNSEENQTLRLISNHDAPTLQTDGKQTLIIPTGQNLALYNFEVGENQSLYINEVIGNSFNNTYRIFNEVGDEIYWNIRSGYEQNFNIRAGKYTIALNRGSNENGTASDSVLHLNFKTWQINDQALGTLDTVTQTYNVKALENSINSASFEIAHEGLYQIDMESDESVLANMQYNNHQGWWLSENWDSLNPTQLIYLTKGTYYLNFEGTGDIALTTQSVSATAALIAANTLTHISFDTIQKQHWYSYQNADASSLSLALTSDDNSQYQINVFDALGNPIWQGLGSDLNSFNPTNLATKLYVQISYLGTDTTTANLQINDNEKQLPILNLEQPNQVVQPTQDYAFSLDKEQLVWVSGDSQNANQTIRIVGERGQEYNANINNNGLTPIWLPAGSYHAIVSSDTQDAQFTITDASQISLVEKPEQGSMSLTTNQSIAWAKINLDKDKLLTLAGVSGNYQGTYFLYDKYGKVISNKSNNDTNLISLSLNYSGEYYLAFNRANGSEAANVYFSIIQKPLNLAAVDSLLALNTTTNLNFADLRESNNYHFSVIDISYFNLSLNGNLMADLYDSRDNLVQSLSSNNLAKTLLTAGDYTLKVKPTYINGNRYNFTNK